ncbi:MAG TPA: type II toxin-antitoxin system RelE/ParE family toxin [Opitutaceae bacterium]|nr:type II toxin-antitoxin system RelE/ParE family toxin [Opitutaceae bacterium]
MKFFVRIETRAARDIDEASGWIAARSPEAAERWFNAIEAEIHSLEYFPMRCPRAREDGLFPYELRQLVYGRRQGRYRVIFTIRNQTVHVLHIRHGALPTMTKTEMQDLLPPE